MVKILRPGTGKDKVLYPWLGVQVTCRACHCVFELEKNDKPTEQWDQRENKGWKEVNCPECGSKVTF